MAVQAIDGASYARMLMGGAALLEAKQGEINALNVFPVADGDTGTNMLRTVKGGLQQLAPAEIDSIGEVSGLFSKGALLSARGNSGVILSQIFAGINEGLSGCDTADAVTLARAFRMGVAKSYASVQNPTEGTILTVFRESVDKAALSLNKNSSVEDFFTLHIEEARRSLLRTKELLPVLKEADVIDSGAAGYLCIAEGMLTALTGKELPRVDIQLEENAPDIDRFTRNSVLEFGYCTEFLLRLTVNKCDPDLFEVSELTALLENLGGESIVAYKTDDAVKVHVHTFAPGEILAASQQYGEFLTVKVENMSLGHTERENAKRERKKKLATVAVASGDGMEALFLSLGADIVISGGQTTNPSTGEFIEAFDKCGAENILVLPNNGNVYLAAKQAKEMYSGASVHIINSKSMMQGYAALNVITPGITDVGAIVQSADMAAAGVVGCEVTRAVRSVPAGSVPVREGDYIAIVDGRISAAKEAPSDTVLAALEKEDCLLWEIITVFYGKEVSEEERAVLSDRLQEAYPDCEINFYRGGQDVYDYMIAIE